MSRKTNRLSVVSLPIGFNRKSPIEMGCYCYCHCFIPRNFNRKLFFFLLLPNNRPIMNFTDSCFHAIISFLIFTLISFRHWFLLQFNVLFVDMKATKNCLSSLEFLGKLYDFVVVSMDEEKKAKFENEEKINPFGSMNQINLDVDFSLSLAHELRLRFDGNAATILLFQWLKAKHIPSMWVCQSISGWKLRMPLMDFCWMRRDVFHVTPSSLSSLVR